MASGHCVTIRLADGRLADFHLDHFHPGYALYETGEAANLLFPDGWKYEDLAPHAAVGDLPPPVDGTPLSLEKPIKAVAPTLLKAYIRPAPPPQ